MRLSEMSPYPITPASTKNPQIDRQFASFIQEAQEKKQDDTDLKISNHAQKRMSERGISLEEKDWNTIYSAVEELDGKGSKNSLLIYKDMALIASIHNRTIITALDRDEVDTITNIDSTKFIKEEGWT